MNEYLMQAKNWFEGRSTREKLLVILICLALQYAILYFLFFKSIEDQEVVVQSEIKALNSKIQSWNVQINALKKISQSAIYKKWQSQRKSMSNLKGKYQYQLQAGSVIQWEQVLRTLLKTQTHMTLLQIKNSPESKFSLPDTSTNNIPLYQQKLLLVMYGNFFDTVNYIKLLEKVLPTIHWESLRYEVLQYPNAKIEVEFAIFYEKI